MKVGTRGQVTIPKAIRERLGIGPGTDVEFQVIRNSIVLRKKPRKLNLDKWKGHCARSFRELAYRSVDDYIEDVRRK